jgi:hypothetical protein
VEERNLDFEIPMTRDQWRQVGERAKALRPSGFDWNDQEPDRIRVYLRDEEARGIWNRLLADEDRYGAHEIEIAQFVFNDGRPFAHLEAPSTLDEPQVLPQEEAAVEAGQEQYVRDKWHYLLEESGL